MVYNSNRQYNTRNSAIGRYNTPGQFVAAGGQGQPQSQPQSPVPQSPQPRPLSQQRPSPQAQRPVQPVQRPQQQFQPPMPPMPPTPPVQPQEPFAQRTNQAAAAAANNQLMFEQKEEDVEMRMEPESDSVNGDDVVARPAWMKSKLTGLKKITKKEKRRRQNQHLRRLITPKNAVMVLNEILLGDQLANQQFKVEPAEGSNPYFKNQCTNFCADLTVDGVTYKGYGENKMSARNAAAEQAIRDHIIKRMKRAVTADVAPAVVPEAADSESEETLPMIQLASFALHKLFSEWEFEGHKVPQLRLPGASGGEGSDAGATGGESVAPKPRPPKPPKELPAKAASMHPAMLLTYMRPHLEYRELGVDGDRPHNRTFTMGVEVDGATYIGKASNKKEARRLAAKAACTALFGVQFEEPAPAPPASAPAPTPMAQTA